MNNNKDIEFKISELDSDPTKKYAFFGFIIGLTFPALAWSYYIFFKQTPFTLSGILEMHKSNQLHFLIDLAPIILLILSSVLSKNISKKRIVLLEEIKEKERKIENNANLAKRIGEGDFSTEPETIDIDDTLGNSLLLMRNNLVSTYQKENEQNWVARGKEIIAEVLRRRNNIEILAYETIVSLINYTNTIQGAFYIFDEDKLCLINIATYAYNRKKFVTQEFKVGQGLVGQAAYEKEYIYRKEIPANYITISSGIIGDKKPKTILVAPLLSDEKLQGVIEFASLDSEMPNAVIILIKELSEIIAQTLFNLKVNTRTEKLLRESQDLTKKLQKNEDDLRKNAEAMKLTQIELEKSNKELASQISEVERGQKRLFALLENASEVITIYDEKGLVKYVSPSIKSILGFDPDEMIGKNRFDRGEAVLQEVFNQLLRDPHISRTFEYRYTHKNKEQLWLETTGRNLLGNPAINGIIFNTRDITVKKVAEKAQRMSGEMQALSENSPDMIIRVSPDGNFYYANPMVTEFMGVQASQITKRSINEINADDLIKTFLLNTLKTVVDSGKKFDTETVFPTMSGERIVQFNAIPEYNKEREMETVLFVAHDITERKQIELEIEEKNKSITESINYAQRIQTAILPDLETIKTYLPKSFLFYKPRDVVSGDFPWFFAKDDIIYIAAVDCTGHGVPGALLSFIGYFILNNIVDHKTEYSAGEILDKLHFEVRRTLKQDNPDATARDGMDIALCKINSRTKELQYAGAHRPMYYMKNGELIQYKGDPKAVGGIPIRRRKENDFETATVKIDVGDKMFIFSDGLPDQIGGEDGRKYQASRIRQIIIDNSKFSMDNYKDFFVDDFITWKKEFKQIDDILLIGIEF